MLQTEQFKSRFYAKVEKGKRPRDCWRWIGAKRNDKYGLMVVGGRSVGAHRVSYALHSGLQSLDDIPPRKFVCHSCDTPACVNPAHLALGTAQENHTQMIRRGRLNSGGVPPLSPDQVRAIRLRLSPAGLEDISKVAAVMIEFGLHEHSIRPIVLGKTYSWIK